MSMSRGRKSEMQKTLVLEGLHLFSGAELPPERKEELRQSGVPEAKVGKGFLDGEEGEAVSTNSAFKSVKGKNRGAGATLRKRVLRLGDTRAYLQAKRTGGEIPEDTRENGQGYGTQARRAMTPAVSCSLATLATYAEASAVKTLTFFHVNCCRATAATEHLQVCCVLDVTTGIYTYRNDIS